MKLNEKIILITGASSGVGREISLLFAEEGATVVAVARRKDKLDELAKEASSFPGEIVSMEGDITIDENIDLVVNSMMDRYGRIDVLVNSAGVMDDFSAVGDLTDEQFNKVTSINFIAPMKLCRKVVPIMEKQEKGNIINMASLAGLYGGRAGAAYTTSKYALIGLTKNIAYMYAEKGIRCNAICPSGVDTGISDNIKPNEFGLNRVIKGTGNGTGSASTRDIANLALFLASDDSRFISGDAIVADAGWTAY